ncbi:unnamed protein product [Dracunculus medinensis]|uniref:Transmembrane protein n=1 Tax=Dracunculus medinensis TaxID=318479 RepID=A0A0N4UEN9_DRAME|nr:unnamed protein product [Dracunculus medinensis]
MNTTISSFCMIPIRKTGTFSLAIQSILLVISLTLVIFLILHVDKKILFNESITNDFKHSNDTFDDKVSQLIDDDKARALDYLENATIQFGKPGFEVDLMELIRISTVVYIGMCILWLLSLFTLLASIKLESLDLIIINSIVLCVQMIYAMIHALFISILFFYYDDVNWKSWVITAAVVMGTVITSLLCGLALAMNIAWHRYIVYINDNDECQCISSCTKFIKKTKQKQRTANDYSIPEATNCARLPYSEEPVIQSFSQF